MTNLAIKLTTLSSPEDQRDIVFVPKVWPPSTFAAALDLMPDVEEVEDQLHIGSCVANGVVSSCEMLAKKHGAPADISRLFLYTATLDYEGRLGQEGLHTRNAYKMAYRYGMPPEPLYPYDTGKSAVRPPDETYLEAAKTKVHRYEAVVAPGRFLSLEPQARVDRIKSALNEGLPVGIAMQVTASIFGLAGPWRAHQYRRGSASEAYVGGHFMLIIGYDDSVGMFLVQNSWGPNWGDGGFCGLPYAIVSEMFFEAWVVRNWNGHEVPEAPGIKFEGINRFSIVGRIVPRQDEIGSVVKVWMGAKAPDGRLFLRAPIPLEQLSNEAPAGLDNWTPYTGEMKPTVEGHSLTHDNKVAVVQWRDLSQLQGFKVYLAYGQTPMDWTLSLLCEIPRF